MKTIDKDEFYVIFGTLKCTEKIVKKFPLLYEEWLKTNRTGIHVVCFHNNFISFSRSLHRFMTSVAFIFTVSTVANLSAFKADLTFGNKKESQGTKSGE